MGVPMPAVTTMASVTAVRMTATITPRTTIALWSHDNLVCCVALFSFAPVCTGTL
jgi:hypothetical protein